MRVRALFLSLLLGCSSSGGDGQPVDVPGPDSGLQDAPGVPDSGPEADVEGSEEVGLPDGAPEEVGLPDAEGSCHCAGDDDCGEGQRCLKPGPSGDCVPVAGPGECWVDADCPGPGTSCVGATVCSCDTPCFAPSAPGTCQGPSVCCATDEDCGEGGLCAGEPPGGTCKEKAPSGACWRDADCSPGQTCIGASVCPCTALCDSEDAPGTCQAPVGACCEESSDCGAAMVCVAVGAGSCQSAPAPGECWSKVDCAAGESCAGASACPCNADCDGLDQIGKCAKDAGCCDSDADCSGGGACAVSLGKADGVCTAALSPGKCYNDGHCSGGSTCAGAVLCPCDALCALPVTAGSCVPKVPPPGCCGKDADCPGGVCAVAPGGKNGICFSALPPGKCFADAHCPGGAPCIGAILCGCDVLCDVPATPGTCAEEPLPPGCCTSDAECPAPAVCTIHGGLGGECLPIESGQCYSSDHCFGGTSCVGAVTCPCGALCALDTTPGKCDPAISPPPGCCATNADCGEKTVCVGGPSGTCEPPPKAPACFYDAQCSEGSTCAGATFCPCGAVCFAPTAPGKCTPKGPIPAGCCNVETDCGLGHSCLALPGEGAYSEYLTCVFDLTVPGQCWDDSGCKAGEECAGESPCPCGAMCKTSLPGTCQPASECTADVECAPGKCVAGSFCLPGCPSGDPSCCLGNYCVGPCPGPNPAGCSGDADCPPGEKCGPNNTDTCLPSSCGCDEKTGSWTCTPDCMGGVCH